MEKLAWKLACTIGCNSNNGSKRMVFWY